MSNPTGDRFYIDYVAHEIGHQLGAEHTFNGTSVSAEVPTVAGSVEPGSGSTIALPGICGVENLQDNSDATFHANSILEIGAVVNSDSAEVLIPCLPGGNQIPRSQRLPIRPSRELRLS